MVGPRSRDDVHRDGAWHQVVHCLVVRPDAPARVVLQVRTTSTSTYPGRLDLSVTGHLQAGESPAEGMVREIAEAPTAAENLIHRAQAKPPRMSCLSGERQWRDRMGN